MVSLTKILTYEGYLARLDICDFKSRYSASTPNTAVMHKKLYMVLPAHENYIKQWKQKHQILFTSQNQGQQKLKYFLASHKRYIWQMYLFYTWINCKQSQKEKNGEVFLLYDPKWTRKLVIVTVFKSQLYIM